MKWEQKLLTTELVGGAGHALFLEKPAEFNAILLEWLDGVMKD
jgi:pimeloyl-ACP methyl ester carboxylesterase